MKTAKTSAALPRWGRRLLAGASLLVALYAVLGFFILPAVLKAQLPGRLGRYLGRPVAVRELRLNPFALSLTVSGFAVQEAGGGEFLGWERLYLRLRPSSLVSRTISFRTIELVRPYGRVVVERGGRLNFDDLVQRLGSGAQPEPAGPAGPPRPLRIGQLSIREARITLLDRAMAEPFATTLGPLDLELAGFSTDAGGNPYTFEGRTEAGESFRWTGAFSLAPLASQGRLRIEGLQLPKYHPFLQEKVAFRLASGRLSLRAGYRFQWSAGTHLLRLEDAEADLADLKLAPDQGPAALELAALELRGAQADLIGRSASLASLKLRDGRVSLTRAANGELDLARLLTPRPDPHPAPAAAPFRLTLKELGLTGFRVAFLDQVPARPVRALVEDLALSLRDFSLDPAANPALTLSARLNGKGRLEAEGTVAPFRPAADLKVKLDGLELPAFDPYLAPALAVRLNRGRLNLDGRFSGTFAGVPADFVAFKGNLSLDRFEAADSVRGEPFLGYRRLALTGLDLRSNPEAVAIQAVDLLEPDYRLVISQDGGSNLARALELEPGPVAAGKPLAAVGAALPPSQGPPLRLRIGRTRMSGGRLSFVDRSLEPNAALLITSLEGTATSLSTEPDSQSMVDFRGLAGGLAPLRVQGRAMPLRKDQDTDVTVTIQGSELQDFSPYAGKFLGYAIHKGKLSVDAHVRIQQRQLDALVKTRLDQFYLGDPSHSPDALKLPIRLCLAVLRDRRGVIDLELPVTGNLDDPDLHYGKIVWKTILNVLGKVATSPFALLAKLGGHPDHDLSFVAFAPGSALPDPVAAEKAQALVKAMAERPELGLEAEGSADPVVDAGPLKQQALEQLLLDLRNAGSADPVAALAPEARAPWLQAAYRQAFPPAKETPKPAPPPPPPAEMEQALLGSLTVSADDLAQLADRRVKALLQLLRDAQVDPARLFEVAGAAQGHAPGPRVYLGLR